MSGLNDISHPLPVGTEVEITEKWGAGIKRVILKVVRDGCSGNEWFSYDLGGPILIPEWQVRPTGVKFRIWKGICPKHGHVLWIWDDPKKLRGCPKEDCCEIIRLEKVK